MSQVEAALLHNDVGPTLLLMSGAGLRRGDKVSATDTGHLTINSSVKLGKLRMTER